MATNVSMASEAAIREAVRNIIQNGHMDKIVGNPTHVTLNTLRKQAAKIVSKIPTSQWGGTTGHLALVLRAPEFRIAMNDPNANVNRIPAVPLVPAGLANNLTLINRTRILNGHAQLQNEKWTQEAVDHFMVDRIVNELVDSTYVEELELDYVGFNNETIKTIINHIKTEWCVVTTMDKTMAIEAFKEKWDGVCNITKFAQNLDRKMVEANDIDAEATVEGKLQTYIESMWDCNLFDDKEMNKWESKLPADKTYANAKTYFVPLFKTKTRIAEERRQREERRGNLDSTNSVTSARSSTSRTTTTKPPPSEISTMLSSSDMSAEEQSNMVEYVNNLEGTLTAKNEQLVQMKDQVTSFEKRLETQSKEMAADRKEFMKMMKDFATKGGMSEPTDRDGGGRNGGRDRRRGGRDREPAPKRYCRNCKLEGWHDHEDCWELEKNKDKRPSNWKSVLE